MIYYVSADAPRGGDGSERAPFRTIQQAADLALPGDEVRVLPGLYREYVNPIHAGIGDARITYRSVEKGAAVITGAEPWKQWKG